MRTQRRAAYWLLVFTLGWLLSKSHAHAQPLDLSKPNNATSRYQSPEDLLDMVPFLGELPRTFLWGDGYAMKLSGQELRIDHMGLRSKATVKKRDCMLGFSYITPVAGFFTSRVDLPLFYSPTPDIHEWSMNSLGDYVAYFSKGASETKSLRFVISAKF